MRQCECADELSCQSRRHRPHAEEIKKTIEPKHNEDQPKQKTCDQSYDFHFAFPFIIRATAFGFFLHPSGKGRKGKGLAHVRPSPQPSPKGRGRQELNATYEQTAVALRT